MITHRWRCVHVQTCTRALAQPFIAIVQAVEVCTPDENRGILQPAELSKRTHHQLRPHYPLSMQSCVLLMPQSSHRYVMSCGAIHASSTVKLYVAAGRGRGGRAGATRPLT